MSVKTELENSHNHPTWERECEICNKDMIKLSEGDIIFGSKWYHKDCLKYRDMGFKNSYWKLCIAGNFT